MPKILSLQTLPFTDRGDGNYYIIVIIALLFLVGLFLMGGIVDKLPSPNLYNNQVVIPVSDVPTNQDPNLQIQDLPASPKP